VHETSEIPQTALSTRNIFLAKFQGILVANDDFNISSLAAYLHMMPEKLAKLADRGKLPGRRVAGAWRFSRPEIHQWLETRIGISDDQQLAQMESTLQRAQSLDEPHGKQYADDQAPFCLPHLIPPEAIEIPLLAKTRRRVISAMAEVAASSGLLWDPVQMAEAITAREAMHPTALDNGVALLHPRRPQVTNLSGAVVALGITSKAVPFGGPRLTDIFFLIGATSDHQHLQILARLSRMISEEDWLATLRESRDAREAHELLVDRDEQLM
jgi:PTS system nitrogen regulatory IIA component